MEKKERSATFSSNERWFVAKLGRDVWKHCVLEFLLPSPSYVRFWKARFPLDTGALIFRKVLGVAPPIFAFENERCLPPHDLHRVCFRKEINLLQPDVVRFSNITSLWRYQDLLFVGERTWWHKVKNSKIWVRSPNVFPCSDTYLDCLRLLSISGMDIRGLLN